MVPGMLPTAHGAHEFFAQPVQFGRGDAGLDVGRDEVERVGDDAAGRTHRGKILFEAVKAGSARPLVIGDCSPAHDSRDADQRLGIDRWGGTRPMGKSFIDGA
jgi:hypothetical protein